MKKRRRAALPGRSVRLPRKEKSVVVVFLSTRRPIASSATWRAPSAGQAARVPAQPRRPDQRGPGPPWPPRPHGAGRRRAVLPHGCHGPCPTHGRGQRLLPARSVRERCVKTRLGILRRHPRSGRNARPAPFRQHGPIRSCSRTAAIVSDGVPRRTPAGPPASGVEHAAEGPDVGARIRLQPARLLGRHVGRGADDRARLRLHQRRSRGPFAHPLAVLGDAEVEDLHQPVRAHHDVLGLDVAVDDACAVRGREGARDLDGDVERLGKGQRPAFHEAPQRSGPR